MSQAPARYDEFADWYDEWATVRSVLRPGGWFVASIVHPCFPGAGEGRSSWPPEDGYEHEGWWTSH